MKNSSPAKKCHGIKSENWNEKWKWEWKVKREFLSEVGMKSKREWKFTVFESESAYQRGCRLLKTRPHCQGIQHKALGTWVGQYDFCLSAALIIIGFAIFFIKLLLLTKVTITEIGIDIDDQWNCPMHLFKCFAFNS